MVQKAPYRQRHKDAFVKGDKKDIPPEALAALEAEAAAAKGDAKEQKAAQVEAKELKAK